MSRRQPDPSGVVLDEGKIRLAIGNPDTPGIVLLTVALYTFGDGVFGNPEEGVEQLDPAEMWAGLNERYGTWLTEEGENKLNALVTGLTGALFWTELEVFVSVSTALLDGDLGDLINNSFEDLTATEIMWAMLEMQLAWDDPEVPDFSLNVQEYIDDMLSREQEMRDDNVKEIEQAYFEALDSLREMGVPNSMLREWDADYAATIDEIEEASE